MKRLRLADIFQDSMVLQRNSPIYFWGTGEAGKEWKLRLGETEIVFGMTEDTFCVELPSMEAARGLTLTVTAVQEEIPEIQLEDISIGDVYLAAGQSNMEFCLRYESHFQELKKEEENPDIHMYNVPQIAYEGQEQSASGYGYWFTKDDMAWDSFSSIGYVFAKYIQEETGVPIGIIGCNWGGTSASAWISEQYLQNDPMSVYMQEYEEAVRGKNEEVLKAESEEGWRFKNSYHRQMEWRAVMYGLTLEEQKVWMTEHAGEPEVPMGPYHQWRPAGLYHTMISRVAPYALKGVLWYQGESDDIHGEIYDRTFQALTECWREAWRNPELPFFTVQLAPFGQWMQCTGERYPLVRESQQRASKHLAKVYMASIMDLGMYEDIHPKEKSEIARRLALLVLQHIYGLPVQGEPPELAEALRRKNQLILRFQNVGKGLVLKGRQLKALKIFQDSREIRPSDFAVQKDRLILFFEELTGEEILLFYADEAYCEVNLYGGAGLSVKPFRIIVRRTAAEGR